MQMQFMEALETLEENGLPVPRSIWRQYWATHQRFFRHMCLAAKVPKLVELSQGALANGQSVCVGLQSTGAHLVLFLPCVVLLFCFCCDGTACSPLVLISCVREFALDLTCLRAR
jgi:hypothetical protein